MTATYGAIGRIDYGSRTNTTIPMPASVGAGDHLLLVHVTANSGTAVSATMHASFAAVGSAQTGTDGSFGWRCLMGEKIASGSEPSDYTLTHSSTNSEGMIIRTDGTGTLSIDVSSQNTYPKPTVTTTITGLAVTTTVTDALLYFIAINWDEIALTVPSGMTERQDSQFLYLASLGLSASGSTGNKTITTGSATPWLANMVAIKDVAGGGSATGSRVLGGLLQGRGLVGPWR